MAVCKARLGDQKIRKNAVYGVDGFLGASPEYFRPDAPGQYGLVYADRLNAWVEASAAWLQSRYGDRVINTVLHLDEATPHIQYLILPLDDNGKLNCRALFGGNKYVLSQLQSDYANAVAHLGLARGREGSKTKHTEVAEYYDTLNIGSTLENVRNSLVALNVADITLLSLAVCTDVSGTRKVEFTTFDGQIGLDDEQYKDFVSRTPQALLLLPKPLEIEFPILKYRYAPDIKTGTQLEAFLCKVFSKEAVHCLDTENSRTQALHRYAVDLLPGTFINRKMRFYTDDLEGICHVVPMATGYGRKLPGHLANFYAELKQPAESLPAGVDAFTGESQERLNQFVDSLELGWLLLIHCGQGLSPAENI